MRCGFLVNEILNLIYPLMHLSKISQAQSLIDQKATMHEEKIHEHTPGIVNAIWYVSDN